MRRYREVKTSITQPAARLAGEGLDSLEAIVTAVRLTRDHYAIQTIHEER